MHSRARDLLIDRCWQGALMTTLVLSAVGTQLHPSISDLLLSGIPCRNGHGRNIVNVILVDFRGIDTMGEITVLSDYRDRRICAVETACIGKGRGKRAGK
jgi:multicomponent Na+:H+ antiporter subunit A